FVVESGQHRWALDLGSDRYDLPGYFQIGRQNGNTNRWHYYRNATAGHNTLTVEGHEQIPAAPTPILCGSIGPERKWVAFDLSAAYGAEPGTVRRGGALIGRSIIVQDEIGPRLASRTRWRMHTSAEPVLVSKANLRLRQGDEELLLSILSPRSASLK